MRKVNAVVSVVSGHQVESRGLLARCYLLHEINRNRHIDQGHLSKPSRNHQAGPGHLLGPVEPSKMHLNISKAYQIDLNRMARTYLEHYHHVVMIKIKAAENVGPFQPLKEEQIAKTKMVIEDHMNDSLQTKEVDIG